MIAKAALSTWIIAAGLLSTNGARTFSRDVADGMAEAAIASGGERDNLVRTLASLEVAIANFETGRQMVLDPKGSNDGGLSHCWGQVYLATPTTRTAEGWLGSELRTDPLKCATVVVRLLRASIVRGPENCPLCVYARGPRGLPGGSEHAWAKEASDHREALARRLLREVPWSP